MRHWADKRASFGLSLPGGTTVLLDVERDHLVLWMKPLTEEHSHREALAQRLEETAALLRSGFKK